MLEYLTPVEFVKSTTSGRTMPAILSCETPDGQEVEVVAKFSKGCDNGVSNLSHEIIAACLAADLGLPIPKPYLITLDPRWVATIAQPEAHAAISASNLIAFGSTYLKHQVTLWTSSNNLKDYQLNTAIGIIVFDGIIGNYDRTNTTPNCLLQQGEIRIIDHELAFGQDLVLPSLWKAPWVLGSMDHLRTPRLHIFRDKLRGLPLDFGPVEAAWKGLTDERIEKYGQAVPQNWTEAQQTVKSSLKLIRDARDHMDKCLIEVRRVLT